MNVPRDTRSGRTGFLLATIGSAVGIGSIWKFPYEVGSNGGGAFVLSYVAGLVLIVVPLMFAEFAIGRRGGGDPAASIRAVAQAGAPGRRGTGWGAIGIVEILLADGLGVNQRLQARGIAACLRRARLGAGQIGLCAGQRRLEGRAVDGVERATPGHRVTLGEVAALQDAGDACAHLDVAIAGDLPGVLVAHRQRLRLHNGDRHLSRRHPGKGLRAGRAAARQEGCGGAQAERGEAGIEQGSCMV